MNFNLDGSSLKVLQQSILVEFPSGNTTEVQIREDMPLAFCVLVHRVTFSS